MSALRPLALALALVLVAPDRAGAVLAREDVPEPLRPWIGWVLQGHEAETCPFLHANGARPCVWPGRLDLVLDESGGRFAQQVYVAAESDVVLPGSGEAWPEDVRVAGVAAAVFESGGRPTLRLARGQHGVSGRFSWKALPPVLLVPADTGLVALRVDGAQVAFPRRDAEGRLWLRATESEPGPRPEQNRVEVEVHRRVIDAVPLGLETRITLRVSGAAREEPLGRALPEGFVPTGLFGPLPARLDPDGRLRVQVRAGEWRFTLFARGVGRSPALALPRQAEGAPWDTSEEWCFEADPALRLVELEGAPAVDPTQTELPAAWRQLPAYRLEPGTELRLVEKRRGNEGRVADRLSLSRRWHLDFDGGGATVVDRVAGELRTATRLEMGLATTLGRVAVDGVDQPVTRRPDATLLGVELPLGPLALEADSRVEDGAHRLPAVGWNADVDALEATLELPPGWRLVHASGVDHAHPSWITDWSLLGVFVVMVVVMATLRLFGPTAAALAFVALGLSYTEPGAPRWVWLAVLAAEALRRAVPEGRLARAVRALRLAAFAALVWIALPFAVTQLRAGLFPALERPWQGVRPPAAPESVVPQAAEAPAEERFADRAAQAPRAEAEGKVRRSIDVGRLTKGGTLESDSLRARGYPAAKGYAPDPDARVQTGPGRPDWLWQEVRLDWSGPVERDQELRLWLLPPWLAGAVAVLRVVLLAALVLLLLGRLPRRSPRGWHRSTVIGSTVGGSAVLAIALGLAAPAHADLPSPELLDDLRQRLLESPSCAPSCASAPRLGLSVAPDRLELRLVVDVAAESAVPLPGGGGDGAGFVPDALAVDGRPAAAVRRDAGGGLWLRLAAGSHSVVLAGPLPQRANLEIPLPLVPHRVELIGSPRGWAVLGIDERGQVSGALQLAREQAAPDAERRASEALEPTAIPPFVRVTRTLALGLRFEAVTEVTRIAPPDGAIVLEVPLLPGESVTTAGVRVAEGRALVTLAPGASSASFHGTLPITPTLTLVAPQAVAWTEVWRLDPSPLWFVSTEGPPALDAAAAGTRLREWRPWPGETLALTIERPEGAGGGTFTIDRSQLELRPGLRATDASLTLGFRSSQGGQHFVTLPEGAELSGLSLDGVEQPLRVEGRRVAIALAPGAHEARLAWREPDGIRALFGSAEIDLGAPSVNAHASLAVPEGRWVLFVGGPRLGPSVLFWPVLLVVAALAAALGRVPWTPLRARHWLVLGLGLTQAPLSASALVVAWLLALGYRGRLDEGERTRSWLAFDAFQLVLATLTLVALAALFHAIQVGLLGSPVMQIAGNESTASLLRWYQDRADATLPRLRVLSLSLWFYRAVMLCWSLWVAQALVGWLRWGWQQWTNGGYWLHPRRSGTAPPTDPPLPQSR